MSALLLLEGQLSDKRAVGYGGEGQETEGDS